MPAYRTHVRINLILGLPLALFALLQFTEGRRDDLLAFSGAFIYGTLFLHPDLDLARQTKLFSINGILTLPFRPYSYLFRHRGISHIPFIGTLTRIGWAYGIFTLLGWVFPDLGHPLFLLGGIAIADLYHILLDRIA